jgi:uncharacterized OB-fold protein
MNVFESELRNGRFVVGECQKCRRISWPPGEFCSTCFGDLSWRPIMEHGTLVEASSKDGKVFGIAEFEGVVRVIGTIPNGQNAKPGQRVKVTKCTFDRAPRFTLEIE